MRHEQTHIARLDHLIKPYAFVVLCIHWFNPLAWVAFFISAKDTELSCDERVVKELGGGIKQDYSASLLRLSTGRQIVGGCSLAFGENDTKDAVGAMIGTRTDDGSAVALIPRGLFGYSFLDVTSGKKVKLGHR